MASKKSLIDRFSNWYIPLICAHKYKALAFYLILAVIFAIPILFKPGLKLDADLSHLLPENTPSVKALEESYQRFGSTDRFMIAIQSEDAELVAALQDSISDYIHKNWKGDFVSTQVDNENKFFKDNALLYLPVKHLENIRDNLEDLQLEIGRKNGPLVVDLLGDDSATASGDSNAAAPAKKERVWFDANLPQELGLPDEAAGAFDSFFKKGKEETAATKAGSLASSRICSGLRAMDFPTRSQSVSSGKRNTNLVFVLRITASSSKSGAWSEIMKPSP